LQNGVDVPTELERETATSGAWSSEFLAAIVDSSDDAIIGKTLDGTIISWNRGAEQIYGYRKDEVIGRRIAILIPPDRADELQRIMARLREGKRIDHYQTVRVRKDGRRIDVSVTISPVRGEDGQIVGASTIARDITAQQEAIREALHLREEFASIAAHELRTPMATVYARLQLAERRVARPGIDPELIKRDVALAREASERMLVLINRLLEVSRFKSGRLELERAQTDLAATARAVGAMVEETTGREIVVRVLERAHGATANVDAMRVEQVITNLLDNAAKYSPNGPIEIDVAAGADVVRMGVRDHGPGVPPEQREQIFEPFRRGSDGKGGGVGLGLHVSREIARLHGGSLVLEAPPDGGARFVLTLPKDGTEGEAS
jgi:PAS domain S-box-containing protein